MLEFIPPDDLKKVNRSIKALKAVLPRDNLKDRVIHEIALNKLLEQRDKLLSR
ncbi:hypothetical protein [Clostridium tyrobutyricum]|uniref:hypothetical protein n=1 Tax=Clostridium tyrobutyricum TaxID=1519 RepID=UPI001C38EDEC|nr:hypothetical protein [Clostridium tyrobutyricum]MBV4429041.1 hypothetical protein [Clostridium tyrobutyricum]MBV4444118.1 hypothetical protein [Clostridium tyrobutyricum]